MNIVSQEENRSIDQIVIFNSIGRKVLEAKYTAILNLSGLDSGIYSVMIISGYEVFTEQILIEN